MKAHAGLLINRFDLLQQEAIDSYVDRLTQANHYSPRGLLIAHIREGNLRESVAYTSNLVIYERIAQLTGLDIPTLHATTAHRFTEVLTPPEEPIANLMINGWSNLPILSSGLITRKIRAENDRHFCPRCLRNAAYFRLHWMPLASIACIEHQCLLCRGCSGCGRNLSLRDIVDRRCFFCHYDLVETPVIPVAGDDLGLLSQRVLQSWLMNQVTPEIDMSLPTASIRALFRVVSGIQSVVSRIGEDWPFYHNLSVDNINLIEPVEKVIESYCAFATAFKALLDWPNSFYTFLDHLRKWNNPSEAPATLYQDFGVFLQSWLDRHWLHPDVKFIQDAFDEYLIERYPPSLSLIQSQRYHDNLWLAERVPYVSVPEAQSILGVSPESVRKCVEAGRLRVFASRDYADQSVMFLKKDDVFALKVLRTNVLGVEEVSAILSISTDAVMNLIKDGVLPGLWGGTIAMDYGWYITRQDLHRFLQSLAANVRIGKFSESKCHTLHQACHALGFLSLNMGKVVRILIDNRLPYYRDDPSDSTLASIWFYRSDVKAFIEQFAEDSGWLSRMKVLKRLGIHESTLKSWVDVGFLTPRTEGRIHTMNYNKSKRLQVLMLTRAMQPRYWG